MARMVTDRSPGLPRTFRLVISAGGGVRQRDPGVGLGAAMPSWWSVERPMTIVVEISPGELIDKLTILEIKLEKISEPAKLAHVRRECDLVKRTFREHIDATPELAELMAQLKETNSALWKIEDDIREHERNGDFRDSFIDLARSVYRMNDRRAAIKRRINELLHSDIVEEKSYSRY